VISRARKPHYKVIGSQSFQVLVLLCKCEIHFLLSFLIFHLQKELNSKLKLKEVE